MCSTLVNGAIMKVHSLPFLKFFFLGLGCILVEGISFMTHFTQISNSRNTNLK